MENEISRFYSNGKLLITGEYLVMYGAQSLAVPVNFGQHLVVSVGEPWILKWEASVQDNFWFNTTIDLKNIDILQTSDEQKAQYLKRVLLAAKSLNPYFLSSGKGFSVKTKLTYPQGWGLGSSSTFIANMASWAEINPMQLHRKVSDGSGYDVACATSAKPIVYEIQNNTPTLHPVNYQPSFADHLFFLYIEKKQDTSDSIHHFKKKYQYSIKDIQFINELTGNLLKSESLSETMNLLEKHELFMSEILGIPPIKHRMFLDFSGSIKSLGAWGGDFTMVASPLHFDEVNSYFRNKGFKSLFTFQEMVLNGSSGKIK